jgi:hypothetical protein
VNNNANEYNLYRNELSKYEYNEKEIIRITETNIKLEEEIK